MFSSEEQRERWQVVMDPGLMSSEESSIDEDNEVIVVKSIPWRSEQVNDFFQRLDRRIQTDKSPQAARQMKRRVTSALASSRPKPGSPSQYPAWVFRN